ncbi:hypothetical protein H0H81_002996 [Sphagnurus paluster]|uniref:Uncharacterized protein n=1 Tax=Sphagnurus paluster TaxID=117069 RepID=A0A9P7FP68_9AGAR|nr:hypothetical protein H0H81_002996 [Sphagnurus paluster]
MATPPPSPAPVLGQVNIKELATKITDMIGSTFAGLIQNLPTPQPTVRKNKQQRSAESDDNTSPGQTSLGYYQYGHYYARPGDMFLKVEKVVNCGILHETEDSNDESGAPAIDKRTLDAWNILCKMIPGFKIKMLELSNDHKAHKLICSEIKAGISKVFADDATTFKTKIIAYMLLDAKTCSPLPPLLAGDKTIRGLPLTSTSEVFGTLEGTPLAETSAEDTGVDDFERAMQQRAAKCARVDAGNENSPS